VIYDEPDPPLTFNLKNLNNGITARLATALIPAGTYRQLRLVVSEAELVLNDGTATKVYSSAAGAVNELRLTSTSKSGFKIMLDPPVKVTNNFSTLLVLDFLLTKTFHAIPSNVANPLDATRFQLQPTIQDNHVLIHDRN
jgi:hypothetical protein